MHELVAVLETSRPSTARWCSTSRPRRGRATARRNSIQPYYRRLALRPRRRDRPLGKKSSTYTQIFGRWICTRRGARPQKVYAITPAMREGSGLVELKSASRAPRDVAIAEQHAVTYGAGLAWRRQKPVVAIYSHVPAARDDQLIHDVALQNCLSPSRSTAGPGRRRRRDAPRTLILRCCARSRT